MCSSCVHHVRKRPNNCGSNKLRNWVSSKLFRVLSVPLYRSSTPAQFTISTSNPKHPDTALATAGFLQPQIQQVVVHQHGNKRIISCQLGLREKYAILLEEQASHDLPRHTPHAFRIEFSFCHLSRGRRPLTAACWQTPSKSLCPVSCLEVWCTDAPCLPRGHFLSEIPSSRGLWRG